jgi:excisionase family DNA binding protein
VVSVAEAERLLGVGKMTIYRWLRDGFITGEQLTAGAPWRICIDQSVRNRIVPQVPRGWVGLEEAAKAFGIARQTVMHKVQRGELQAVHLSRGKRKGLRINVFNDDAGLLISPDERHAKRYSVPTTPGT